MLAWAVCRPPEANSRAIPSATYTGSYPTHGRQRDCAFDELLRSFADRKFALLRRTRQGKQGRQPISRAWRQSRNDGNLTGIDVVDADVPVVTELTRRVFVVKLGLNRPQRPPGALRNAGKRRDGSPSAASGHFSACAKPGPFRQKCPFGSPTPLFCREPSPPYQYMLPRRTAWLPPAGRRPAEVDGDGRPSSDRVTRKAAAGLPKPLLSGSAGPNSRLHPADAVEMAPEAPGARWRAWEHRDGSPVPQMDTFQPARSQGHFDKSVH
jgi:hypothetical protein